MTKIYFYQGDDRIIQDTIYEDDCTTPRDITDWTLQFVVKDYRGNHILTIEGDAVTFPNAPEGICAFAIAEEDTASLMTNIYPYFVQRIDDEAIVTVSTGAFYLMPSGQTFMVSD